MTVKYLVEVGSKVQDMMDDEGEMCLGRVATLSRSKYILMMLHILSKFIEPFRPTPKTLEKELKSKLPSRRQQFLTMESIFKLIDLLSFDSKWYLSADEHAIAMLFNKMKGVTFDMSGLDNALMFICQSFMTGGDVFNQKYL